MHRASIGPNFAGGFAPVPQIDVPDDHDDHEQEPTGAYQQQRWTTHNFRSQVQQVLRQSSTHQGHAQESVRSSPAFSDTTLVGGDYLDVPIRDDEEIDIGNGNYGNYVEYYSGYDGPEPVNLSPTHSTKAGLGLEVYCASVPELSPGGLNVVDDPWANISYRGSEGKIEEERPREPQNFKPFVMRWRFLSALFLTLSILVALAELGIQLLPNESGVTTPSQAYNTTEIRLRSLLHNGADLPNSFAMFRRQNNTDPNHDSSTTTIVPTSTETTTSTTSTSTVITPSSTSTSSSTLQITTTSIIEASTSSLNTDTIITSTSTTTIPSIPQSPTTTTPPPTPDTTTTTPNPLPTTTSSTSEVLPPPPPPPPLTSTTSTTQSLPLPPSSLPSSPPSSPTTATSPQVEPPPPVSTSETLPPFPPTSSPPPPPPPPPTSTSENSPPPSSTSVVLPPSSDIPPSPPSSSSSLVLPPTSISLPFSSSSAFTPPATTSSTTLQIPTWPNGPSSSIGFSTISFSSTATQVESSASPGSGGELPTSNPPGSSSTIYTIPSSSLPSSPNNVPTSSASASPPPPPPPPPPPISTSTISTGGLSTPSTSPTYPTSTTHSTASIFSSSTTTTAAASEQQPSSSSISIGSATSISTPSSPIDQPSSTSFSSYSEIHINLPPSGTSTQGSVSYTIDQSVSYSSSAAEIALPVPFTTITETPTPVSSTTIVTSVSQSDGSYLESTIVSLIHGVKAPLTNYATTHMDSLGRPTWTETFLAQTSQRVVTYTDANGKTTTATEVILFQPSKTTLTDYQGRATKTLDYYIGKVTEVLTDANGRPTATKTHMVSETVSLTTLLDSNGVPTLTKTELVPMSITSTLIVSPTSTSSPNSESSKTLHIVPISDGKYFLGLMLPTFIAILISIPIRILDRNAKLYQPFHALVSSGGAEARDSLCLQTADIWSFRARIRSLLNGQILLTLTGLLLLGSVVMIPLASEAVRIILEGPDCAASKTETLTCKMALGVYTVPAQIAVALLVFMTILAGVIALVLRNWRTGLDSNPWSMFHMAELAAHTEIRNYLRRHFHKKERRVSNREVNKAFAGMHFCLEFWKENSVLKYSILIANGARSSKKVGRSVTFKKERNLWRRENGNALPFFVLTWTGRLLFLALLCAAEIGLLVYNITGEGQDYTEFIMGKWRVVRFFFTFVGVLISLTWGSFFYAVAFISPHKLLERKRLYNGKAAHITPPTNPFSGLQSSFSRNRRDIYLGVVSATAILSEILPLLLSVALDKCTENFWANTVCLWMAASLLAMMIFTVTGSFFVTWPHMPIDPSTIAGGMYYALVKYVSRSPSSGMLLGRASPGFA